MLVAPENVKYRCRKTDDCLAVLLSTFLFYSGEFFLPVDYRSLVLASMLIKPKLEYTALLGDKIEILILYKVYRTLP